MIKILFGSSVCTYAFKILSKQQCGCWRPLRSLKYCGPSCLAETAISFFDYMQLFHVCDETNSKGGEPIVAEGGTDNARIEVQVVRKVAVKAH